MEHQENPSLFLITMIHRLQLGLDRLHCGHPTQQAVMGPRPAQLLADSRLFFLITQDSKPAWQTCTLIMHFPPHLPFPMKHIPLPAPVQVLPHKAPRTPAPGCQPFLDTFSNPQPPKPDAITLPSSGRPALVGRCQHLLWHWSSDRRPMGHMEMVIRLLCWPKPRF